MDVSFDAWKVVQAVLDIDRHAGRCTLTALADLCRGLGGAQYKIADETGRPSNASAKLNLDALGGKLNLSRENAERLLVQLVLTGYLTESFQATAYTVNVYVAPGRYASKMARHSLSDARHLRGMVHLMLHDASMEVETGASKSRGAAKRAAPAPAAAKRPKSDPIEID